MEWCLLQLYHGVVLAYGAEADRSLGIPGEDLGSCCTDRLASFRFVVQGLVYELQV